MKPYKPYVSIDLETTGLDTNNSQILEIAAIYDDGGAIENLKTFHRIIKYEKIQYAEPYALVMNTEIIKESLKTGITPELLIPEFLLWLNGLASGNNRLVVAGKNVAGFDIPMLQSHLNRYSSQYGLKLPFTHRTIDVGSLYFDVFGENVTLGKINELTGRAANVSHRAMDDAMDVVYAIRHKMRDDDELSG